MCTYNTLTVVCTGREDTNIVAVSLSGIRTKCYATAVSIDHNNELNSAFLNNKMRPQNFMQEVRIMNDNTMLAKQAIPFHFFNSNTRFHG